MDNLERRLKGALERGSNGSLVIRPSAAPTLEERERLEARRRELDVVLRPADDLEIIQRVAKLALRFPSTRVPDEAGTTQAYSEELREFPLWAIDEGIRLVSARRRGSHAAAFFPSADELVEGAREARAPVYGERVLVGQILAAAKSGDDDAMRQKVAGAIGRLADNMRERGFGVGRKPGAVVEPVSVRQARAMEELERIAAKPPVMRLSAEALRACGIRPVEKQEKVG